nr:zinc finger, CCHC-type, retrotransposon Gag domain protein [Tanacetum cinerariifolium]
DAFADTCTWVAFREIFYNRYFSASEQERYEHKYRSICQLDRENSREYMERGRQDRGYDSKQQDFQGQDQRSAGRNGNDLQGQGNYNQRQHRNQSTWDFNQGHALGSSG